uniref:Wall-associated receptor kinase 2-like n=2 Tax=Nelumbo nucifera TaxID=4432 RepID=A0A822Z7S0_NELNU|nr:TPA_asm: hypothetical protein HUJ06_013752 [Nelumbo nucifera]
MVWHKMLHLILLRTLMMEVAAEVASSTSSQTKPDCQDKCGNISIPYPFGVGDNRNCFLNEDFRLTCNTAGDTPLLQISDTQPVLSISLEGQLTAFVIGPVRCYMGADKYWQGYTWAWARFANAYRISDTRNRFMAIGCEMNAYLSDFLSKAFYVMCSPVCLNNTTVTDLSCASHLGCCQSIIPKNVNSYLISMRDYYNLTYTWNASRCAFAILSDQDWLASHVSQLWNTENNVEELVKFGIKTPVVLDWAVRNKSCEEAQREATDYACRNNSYCTNSSNGPGYLCHCMKGFYGNPYLPDGCQVMPSQEFSFVYLVSIENKTCEKGATNYACGNNTYCSYLSDGLGYTCQCIEDYHGNPYLPDGCQASTPLKTRPNCRNKCGNVSIPYPFGLVGDDPTCYRDEFKLFCNTAMDPPELMLYGPDYMKYANIWVLNISLQGQLTFSLWAAAICYMGENQSLENYRIPRQLPSTYRLSNTRNKFTVIGCNTIGVLSDFKGERFHIGCTSSCPYATELIGPSCDGIGCCQAAIPKDLDSFYVALWQYDGRTRYTYTWNISRCSYAFLCDQDWFSSNASNLWELRNEAEYIVNVGVRTPVVLDWAIRNKTCQEAKKDLANYACGSNTYCADSTNGPGYLCHCMQGYDGNPYVSDGCQDVNECEDPKVNTCESICINTVGSYYCSCPKDSYGDGIKNGKGCTPKSKVFPVIKVTLGIGFGILLFLVIFSWLYFFVRKRKLMKLREKFFEQNGGLLLQQQLSSYDEGGFEFIKIFRAEELELATNNYDADCILGRGGQGTVYKGILPNHRVVAIKKSRIVDECQIEQFINEVIILSQINHRNVVKLLGCCLETEVPLLVYEYISNGTVFDHIHKKHEAPLLSWEDWLRIATETADALAYLHSAASIPVIHRDIKSANILLDDNYAAKVSDFGVSRLLPMDQTQITTLVQGTLGYLDPEYFHTSKLTEKSDVYSFGVVLVEILTCQKPLCFERTEEQRNLATYFISSMKENRIFELIENQFVNEGNTEQLLTIAELAKRCLSVRGEERPTMKEVSEELEGLRRERHPWVQPTHQEESEHLLSNFSDLYPISLSDYPYNASGQHSMESSMTMSMKFPR